MKYLGAMAFVFHACSALALLKQPLGETYPTQPDYNVAGDAAAGPYKPSIEGDNNQSIEQWVDAIVQGVEVTEQNGHDLFAAEPKKAKSMSPTLPETVPVDSRDPILMRAAETGEFDVRGKVGQKWARAKNSLISRPSMKSSAACRIAKSSRRGGLKKNLPTSLPTKPTKSHSSRSTRDMASTSLSGVL